MKTITVTYLVELTGHAPDEQDIAREIEDVAPTMPGCDRAYVRILTVDRNLPSDATSRD